MDFSAYVNSKDIAKYLHDIGYEFNSKEAAWLINQCHSLSLKERHEAWERLMKELPDYDLGERFSFLPGNSLYELIRRNIKYQEKEYELFNKKEADTVYHYRFYCYRDHSWCEDYEGVYASLEDCWNEIEKDMDLDIEVIDIKKRYISSNRTIEVRFTPNSRKVMDIYSNYTDEDDCDALGENFDGMWFDFPVPFEKGDILVPVHTPGPRRLWAENGPVVIDNITPWAKELNERIQNFTHGDSTDMLVWGYFQDPDGRIYHEGEFNYMDYEYYEDPFTGPRRLLIALSNFIKGEISIEMLLSAYRKIIMDEVSEDVMLKSWYSEECLRRMGLEDVIEDNNRHIVESGLNPNICFYKRFYDDAEYEWDSNIELFDKCLRIANDYHHQPKEMLYVYGNSGCGKTTLLQCCGNLAKRFGMSKLIYTTAENFANEVISAIKNSEGNTIGTLRKKYRTLNFFIIDDIQYLNGKETAIEEFTYTLNDLLCKGAQVLISADRPLDELEIPETLKSKISFATQMHMNARE